MNQLYSRKSEYKGEDIIEMSAGNYYAMVFPKMGSNMIRLRDTKNNIDVFRFSEDLPIETYRNSRETYGWPTLYLPNRLDNGMLKTSDGLYRFPNNEAAPFSNMIHGFLHKREHQVKELYTEDKKAVAVLTYHYDKNDEMFTYFPVEFILEIKYVLSCKGVEQYYSMTNLSDKMLPVGIGSHTSIKAPFADDGLAKNMRLYAAIGKRLMLNERCLTTGDYLDLKEYDLGYCNGTINPATTSIDNNMYFALTETVSGKDFHGIIAEDIKTGKKVIYETGEEYKFWIFWNEWGNKGYFCPEPMTWMINAPNLNMPKEETGYREIKKNETFTAYQHIYTED